MAGSKITEREQAQAIKRDASLLITQQESVNGKEVESLLRAKLDTLLMALHGIGAPSPLVMCESAQPAQIWPEEGSPLRPVISMLPAQSGSGDPSPENVRPISGRAAVMVTRCGRNLLPTPYTFAAGTTNGVSITKNENGSVTLNGTATADTIHTLREKMSLPGGKYILSGFHDTTSFIYAVTYYANGDRYAFHYAYTGEVVCTVPPGGLITVSVKLASGAAYNNRTIYPMLRPAGDADAAYEPYRGETFSLPLGQTVYGGTLDAAKGELTVTHKLIALKDRNWTESSKEAGRFLSNITIKPYVAPICDVLPGKVWNADNAGLWEIANNYGTQLIVRTDLTTLDEWKAWLAANDPHVCYELETPETVQLDPAVIPALEGLNTVTSTGESMTLTYNKSLVREHEEIRAQLDALPENVESTLEQMKADGVLVGIESIDVEKVLATAFSSGYKIITIKTTDGKETRFTVVNGADGKDGATITGVDATRHTDSDGVGYTAVSINVRESDDSAYEKMFMIKDGRTPAKGVDYWTDEDKKEINDYIASMVEQEVAKRLAAE